ncbi:MmgE/PrpD family protein [Pigmentiphaga soli]|uniref:MmgE/PrpD family protein n=1 Tax=Pigmentiphaga soli TaxID=1007095 RepID=A0ABP8H9U1_9BURK
MKPEQSATVSRLIAAFAVAFRERPLSPAQRHVAYRALLDTVAVAIAGRGEQAPRFLRDYLSEMTGSGRATAWTTGERLPAEAAALLNGTAAHMLDYDDMLPPMVGHPSVVLVPPLAALAEMTGADGRRFAQAYVAGFEVLAKISAVMALPHVVKGWHSTASIGTLGAAVAASVLLGLDEVQTMHALGLAIAQTAGNRQNFGTMAKSFQVGQAGSVALRAALLAQRGFDAPRDALEGKYGYMALYAANEDLTAALDTLGRGPLDFDAIGIDVKKYPCCYALHKPLDGVLGLRAAHGLGPDDVERVEIVTQKRGLQPLVYTDPKSGLEAKFSMEYCVAAALLDGRIRLSSFDADQVTRPQVRALYPRIAKREVDGDMLPRWAEVTLHLKGGAQLRRRVDTSRGDAQDPLTDAELVEKAEDCFAFGGLDLPASAFAAEVFALADQRVADVLGALRAPESRGEVVR